MQNDPDGRPRRHRALLAAAALSAVLAATACQRPVAPPIGPDMASPAPDRCRVFASGSGEEEAMERHLLHESCDRSLAVVTEMWPEWTGDAPIHISPDALAPGTAAQVEGFVRGDKPTRGDRVIVTPGLTDALTPEGLDVVLRHELTHLAMRSTGTVPLPLWASEGIAMHIGYASVSGPRRERRPELVRLRDRVERGDWTTVPASARFDDPDHRADAYSGSWLGVEVLIDRLGWPRVLEALRAPSRESAEDRADEAPMDEGDEVDVDTDEGRTRLLLDSLGVSEQWLAEQWRAELVRRTS